MGAIRDNLYGMNEKGVLEEVSKALAGGASNADILGECQEAMTAVGDSFGKGDMFIADLMMSAMIFEKVTAMLPDVPKSADEGSAGKVVLGTVKNDIHNIGKDLVKQMMASAGYEVIDVGVDVPAARFVSALQESGAKVLAMSCLLTSSYPSLKEAVDAVRAAGFTDTKIIVGGAPVDEKVAEYAGADGYGKGPHDAVNFCKSVYGN